MHRYALLAILTILAAVSTAGAQWKPAELGVGVKAGVGISDVAYHTRPTDPRTAYLLGAILNYKQNRWFSFQMELLYTVKGYRRNDVSVRDTSGVIVGTSDLEFILGYLEVPVLGKFSVPMRGKYRPYAVAGGFMSLSVYDKYRVSAERVAVDFGLQNVETVDLGATVGIGVDIKAGNGWVSFETRFDSSLLPAIKDEDQKSQAVFFQLGYWW
jgi:hypothetical protein